VEHHLLGVALNRDLILIRRAEITFCWCVFLPSFKLITAIQGFKKKKKRLILSCFQMNQLTKLDMLLDSCVNNPHKDWLTWSV